MPICRTCNQDLPADAFSADKLRKNGLRYACKSCSAVEFQRYKATPAYTARLERQKTARTVLKAVDPVTRWADIAIGNARRRAKANGIVCTIDRAWLIANAPTHCPLLETALDYGADVSGPTSASVDRRDSHGGYTPDNCRVISFKANRIKTNATVEELRVFAKNIEHY